MIISYNKLVITMALFACALNGFADSSLTASGKSLSMIMADPDWIGNPAQSPRFTDDGKSVIYRQKRMGVQFNDYFQVDLHASDAEKPKIAASQFDEQIEDRREHIAIINSDGNLFLVNFETNERTTLTQSAASDSSARFMTSNRKVLFSREGQQYSVDTKTGLVTQLTNIRIGAAPTKKPDYSFLRNQQLITTRNETQRRKEAQRALEQQRARNSEMGHLQPVYLGDKQRLISNVTSTDGEYSIVVTTKTNDDGKFREKMPNYVTDSGYTELVSVRAKVGEQTPSGHTLALVKLATGEITPLDLSSLSGIKNDPLKKLRASAVDWHVARGADRVKMAKKLQAEPIRSIIAEGIKWNNAGTVAAIQLHSIDNKDRWLITIDPRKPKVTLQHRLTDERWINYAYNDFGWMPDNQRLWFLSEQTGYSHLYLKKLDKRRAQPVTRGDYIVESPALSVTGDYFTVIANPENAGRYEIYRVSAKAEMTKISSLSADPQYRVGGKPFITSPDETGLLYRHSAPNKPPEWYLQANRPNAASRQATKTTSLMFSEQSWQRPEFVDIPSTNFDGTLRARIYSPETAKETLPIVVFVHGAGYLQNAHTGWSDYFREYMFNNLLAEQGYLVLDLDYRGSRGYGRDFRTAIYRSMGHPELEDLLDGIDWLVANRRGDPDRVGVYGGSYGGFMALMAMFRAPDKISAAAALRPVTDWAHYNHGYTSNILNTPLVDPSAYTLSSPIYYAEVFPNKPLLIAHGMQDSNVHVQDSIKLQQRLIELEKENFELALYPIDSHGFKYPSSWLDEYRRIFKLFEDHVR